MERIVRYCHGMRGMGQALGWQANPFHCDNKAVTEVWQSGLSHSTQLMRLVRALFFVAANGNFHVLIRHIAGVDNCIADALSRLQVQKFRQLAPQAAREPTPIPATLTFT